MQNIISVTSAFKTASKDFSKHLDHTWRIFNDTAQLDITQYVRTGGFTVVRSEKSKTGLTTSDSFKFDVQIHKSKPIEEKPANTLIPVLITDTRGYRDVYTDDPAITNVYLDDNEHINDLLNLTYLNDIVDEGDKIIVTDTFNGETITVYTGYAKKTKQWEKNIYYGYTVTVYDSLFEGITGKWPTDEVLVDKYICKNSDPTNSLAHILASKMGFLSQNIKFDDCSISGEFLKVPFVYWKKDTQYLAEFTKLADAINGKVFCNNINQMVFTNPYNDNDYNDISFAFDTANIRKELQKVPVQRDSDRVKVVYDSYTLKPDQVVWALASSDDAMTAKDDANWSIGPNATTNWYTATYITDIAVGARVDTSGIVAYYFNGTTKVPTTLVYETKELTNSKMVFRFINKLGYTLWIEKFKVLGQPLFKMEGNEVSYTELLEPVNTSEISNDYIQTDTLARLYAQYAYLLLCKNVETYTFKALPTTFLALSNKVTVKSQKMANALEFVVTGFEHTDRETSVTVQTYIPYNFINGEFTTSLANPVDNNTVDLINKLSSSTVVVSSDTPSIVSNIKATAHVGIIEVTWDLSARTDIKGYWIEYKNTQGASIAKRFRASSSDSFVTTSNITYTVTVWAVTLKNVEGEQSTINLDVFGQPIKALQGIEENYDVLGKLPEAVLSLNHSTTELYNIIQNLDPEHIVLDFSDLQEKVNTLLTDDGTAGRVVELESGLTSIEQRTDIVEGPDGIEGLKSITQKTATDLTAQIYAAKVPAEYTGIIVGVDYTNKYIHVPTDLSKIDESEYTKFNLVLYGPNYSEMQTNIVTNIVCDTDENGNKTSGAKIYIIYVSPNINTSFRFTLGRPSLVGSMIQQSATEIKNIVYGVDWDDKYTDDYDIEAMYEDDDGFLGKPTASAYTEIVQTKDYINMLATNNENKFSELTISIDGILTTVEDTKAELYSAISQSADDILATVANKSETDKAFAALQLRSDYIMMTAYKNNSDTQSSISQLKLTNDEFSVLLSKKVGNDSIISSINQTAESIAINASKISLGPGLKVTDGRAAVATNPLGGLTIDENGLVKIGALDASWINVGTLSAARLATGSITASKLRIDSENFMADSITGALKVKNISADNINAGALISNVDPTWNFFDLDHGHFSVGNSDSHMIFDESGVLQVKGSITLDGDTNVINFQESGWVLSDYNHTSMTGLAYNAVAKNIDHLQVATLELKDYLFPVFGTSQYEKDVFITNDLNGSQTYYGTIVKPLINYQGTTLLPIVKHQAQSGADDINIAIKGLLPADTSTQVWNGTLQKWETKASSLITKGTISFHEDKLWLWRENKWNLIL